jgi:hypothetical protein
MSNELDPRVLELCGRIAKEKNQATLLRLITELNHVLHQTGPQSGRDANMIAAD